MIVLEMTHTDNKSLLKKIAGVMGMSFNGEDFIELKPPLGQGIIKVITLADDLQVLLADIVVYHYLIARRNKSDERYFVLHFDDVEINEVATFKVDGDILEKRMQHFTAARLTSNVFDNSEEVSANSKAKVVKVFFSEKWLKRYLDLGDKVDGLQQYISLKTASYDTEPLDTEYLQLMNELWNVNKNDPLQNVFIANRVTLLIERFFSRLVEKMKHLDGEVNIDQETMAKLIAVENSLTRDFSEKPLSIDALSKSSTMSATKLKREFKKMYGMGIYTYYQNRRLQKAREMLAEGNFSIKHIANATGFNTPSNFATAFKKKYKLLPSQLQKAV